MAFDVASLTGAAFLIMLFSYLLYKRTMLFDIAEASLVGTAAGYSFIMGIKAIRDQAIYPLQAGDLMLLVPVILGLLLYTRLRRETAYISRIPTAIIVGVGMGLSLRNIITASIIRQIQTQINAFQTTTPMKTFSSILLLVGFVTSLMYFVFTREHTGVFGYGVKIGRYFMMATFGTVFGAMAMYRLAIIAGQVRFLMQVFGLIPG